MKTFDLLCCLKLFLSLVRFGCDLFAIEMATPAIREIMRAAGHGMHNHQTSDSIALVFRRLPTTFQRAIPSEVPVRVMLAYNQHTAYKDRLIRAMRELSARPPRCNAIAVR